MSPTPRSEPRNSSGFGRAAAVVAACGLIFGVGGTAVPLPTATEILASDDRWQQPGVVVPASATLSFRPYGSLLADGGFSTGTGPGLGGIPGISASPGSPGFGAAFPGFPGGGGVPGSSLFAQPDPASVEGGLGSSLFAQPGPASAKGSLAAVVPYAYKGLGHSYVWGGTSFANGWDCSGFAQWAFAQAGFYLPRVSQWEVLAPTNTPRPGDLVTQRPDGPNHWAHVGIYIGDGMMISALNPDQGTIIHSVGPPGTSWYFTLPGTENIPYSADEREPGAKTPRATPPVRFSVPSTIADNRGNDGQARADRSDNRRNASGSDNDNDRRSKADRNDGNNKKSSPARHDQPSNDRDTKRDNKPSQKNSNPPKNQQDRGKVVKPDKSPSAPPKDHKPNKPPTAPPKDSTPNKTPAPTPKPSPPSKPGPAPQPPATTPPPAPKPAPAPQPPATKPPVSTPEPPVTTPPPTSTPEPSAPPVQQTTPPPPPAPPATTPPPAPNISGNLNAAVGALANGPGGVLALGTVVATPQVGDIILYTDAAGKSHVAVFVGNGMVQGADGTQSAITAGGTYQIIRPA